MWSPIGIAIIVLIVALFVLEMIGVYGPKGKNNKIDTITEVYRYGRDKLPTPLRYILMFLITGLLFWTIIHFFDLV